MPSRTGNIAPLPPPPRCIVGLRAPIGPHQQLLKEEAGQAGPRRPIRSLDAARRRSAANREAAARTPRFADCPGRCWKEARLPPQAPSGATRNESAGPEIKAATDTEVTSVPRAEKTEIAGGGAWAMWAWSEGGASSVSTRVGARPCMEGGA